jgi:hypothetical protein
MRRVELLLSARANAYLRRSARRQSAARTMPAAAPILADALASFEAVWGGLAFDHWAFGVAGSVCDVDGVEVVLIATEWRRERLYLDGRGWVYGRDAWGEPLRKLAESVVRFVERLALTPVLKDAAVTAEIAGRRAATLGAALGLDPLDGASGGDAAWLEGADLLVCDGRPLSSTHDLTTVMGSLGGVIGALRQANVSARVVSAGEFMPYLLKSAAERPALPSGAHVVPLFGCAGVLDLHDAAVIRAVECHDGSAVVDTRWTVEGVEQIRFTDAADQLRPFLSPRGRLALPSVRVSYDPRQRLAPDAAAELLYSLGVDDPGRLVALEQTIGGLQFGDTLRLGLRFAAYDGEFVDIGTHGSGRVLADLEGRLYVRDEIDGSEFMIAETVAHFFEREVRRSENPERAQPYFTADGFVGAAIAVAISAAPVAELSDAAMRFWTAADVEVHESPGSEDTLVTHVQAASVAALGAVIATIGHVQAMFSTPYTEIRALLESAGLATQRQPERFFCDPVNSDARALIEQIRQAPSSTALRAHCTDGRPLVRRALAERADLTVDDLETIAAATGHVLLEDVVVLDALARHPAADAFLLRALANHDVAHPLWAVVPRAIAMHPATAAAMLERLARNSCPEVRDGVALNLAAPAALIDGLCRDDDARVRRSAARHPVVTPAALGAMVTDAELWVRLAVAGHAHTSVEALATLASDRNAAVAYDLASRKSLPSAIAHRVAYHPFALRDHAAAHPALPIAAMHDLAASNIAASRRGIASNPSAPPALLRSLIDDDDPEVRNRALGHPSLRDSDVPHGLMALRDEQRDKHPIVTGPWKNPPTLSASERLGTLFDRRSPSRDAWASHPTYPACLLGALLDEAEAPSLAVAFHPWVSAEVLARIADLQPGSAHDRVASHERTPVAALLVLSRCDTARVRAQAAANPRLPASELTRLAKDDDAVRASVARRPDCPRGLLVTLTTDEQPRVRGSVAQNEHAPASLLTRLRNDRDPHVRAHLAMNPAVSDVASWPADPERIVRDAQRWRLFGDERRAGDRHLVRSPI